MKKIGSKQVPQEVRDLVNKRRNKYFEIYEKLSVDEDFGPVYVECDDEVEARKIAAAVRNWAYRQLEVEEGDRRVSPFQIYIDGATVWIEPKQDS